MTHSGEDGRRASSQGQARSPAGHPGGAAASADASPVSSKKRQTRAAAVQLGARADRVGLAEGVEHPAPVRRGPGRRPAGGTGPGTSRRRRQPIGATAARARSSGAVAMSPNQTSRVLDLPPARGGLAGEPRRGRHARAARAAPASPARPSAARRRDVEAVPVEAARPCTPVRVELHLALDRDAGGDLEAVLHPLGVPCATAPRAAR